MYAFHEIFRVCHCVKFSCSRVLLPCVSTVADASFIDMLSWAKEIAWLACVGACAVTGALVNAAC